uniref:Uncharacterized protein LOC105036109 n=1 Tax=Elaeis guineensis var. tenera TaxID=51953 RepID=A0A6I9QIM0_ELAGV|nr:uncharacterized protein LOC105036109 [Elaeis guineensis]
MADNTRGIELRRVEESLRQSTKDTFQRIETIEGALSRMEDMMLQLSRQQSKVMQKLQDGSPSGGLLRGEMLLRFRFWCSGMIHLLLKPLGSPGKTLKGDSLTLTLRTRLLEWGELQQVELRVTTEGKVHIQQSSNIS